MTEPRRVLIDWDYGAHGIWWVLTRQEKKLPPQADDGAATRPHISKSASGPGATG